MSGWDNVLAKLARDKREMASQKRIEATCKLRDAARLEREALVLDRSREDADS